MQTDTKDYWQRKLLDGLVLTIGLYLATLPFSTLDQHSKTTIPTTYSSQKENYQPDSNKPHTFLKHQAKLSSHSLPTVE